MDQLSLGVVARSRKENERRLPIHPHHLDRIDADLRETIYLEYGYGEPFGVPDERLAGRMVGGMRTREQLIAECDVTCWPSRCGRTSPNCGPVRCCGAGHTVCRTPS